MTTQDATDDTNDKQFQQFFDDLADWQGTPVLSNVTVPNPVTPSTISIQFRNARCRTYFAVEYGQELNCTPYKYNVRLVGITSHQETYMFELYVVTDTKLEPVQNGITVEKKLILRHAPANTVDYRIGFNAYSYSYGNKLFVTIVRNVQAVEVCRTNAFEIIARRHRKRAPKKKKEETP